LELNKRRKGDVLVRTVRASVRGLPARGDDYGSEGRSEAKKKKWGKHIRGQNKADQKDVARGQKAEGGVFDSGRNENLGKKNRKWSLPGSRMATRWTSKRVV